MTSLKILFKVITISSLYSVLAFVPSVHRQTAHPSGGGQTTSCSRRNRPRSDDFPALKNANDELGDGGEGVNKNDQDKGEGESQDDDSDTDTSWIQKAMNMSPEDKDLVAPKLSMSFPLKSGISGFAIDPELGFICVLSPENYDDNDDDSGSYSNGKGGNTFTYAIVSPSDTKKLSAEALCLIQLAGGLDLGAAVFPPDILARLVAAELMDEDEDDEIDIQELRSKVTLLGVTALKNEKYSPNDNDPQDDARTNAKTGQGESTSEASEERDANIKDGSPKMLPALRNLPGLTEVTMEQIESAMQIHADADGKLDRQGFSELLGTLRGNFGRIDDQKVKFRLTASISDSDSSGGDSFSPSKLVDVDHVPPFQAIALAMRYKSTIIVSEGCLYDEGDGNGNGNVEDSKNVFSRFPAFKPVQELVEDAKLMDGFISSMFFKETAPDNDDKAL